LGADFTEGNEERKGRASCGGLLAVYFVGFFLLLAADSVEAQAVRLKLSTLEPGSEKVQLVSNGDFQFQGQVITNNHPFPDGWARQADMFARPGTNMVTADNGVVAQAYVTGAASVCKYERTINLEPNSDYILSAYLWNMGNAANHVTTVIDLNDAPNEPQFLLSWPASATPLSLLCATNLAPPVQWQPFLDPVQSVSNLCTVITTNARTQRYFHLGDAVDPTTLNRKLMMGYQAWFACPNDGSPVNKWQHWFSGQSPSATNATVDFWPDVSECDPDELFDTGLKLPSGAPANVYSGFNQKTVLRHFKWMKDYHLDGVFLQRFTSELASSSTLNWRNQVAGRVRLGAETYGRVFGIMYDISGQSASTLVSTLTNDWLYLASAMQLTSSPRYIKHKGKPVVVIWGFGFTDRPGTPADAQTVISFFKNAGCTVMGGVPTYWRTLGADSQTNPAWATAYRSFDIISPWSVGRFGDQTGSDSFVQNVILPDRSDTLSHGLEYMPVIFPGFSWYNLNHGTFNQIPRYGGNFYWHQVFNAVYAGCTMLYGAMFDEMNEGTSMLKMAPTPAQLPAQGRFVPLNVDGEQLPSDWYLRMADQASRMLRGNTRLQSVRPINP
jgi:hypothetical protein